MPVDEESRVPREPHQPTSPDQTQAQWDPFVPNHRAPSSTRMSGVAGAGWVLVGVGASLLVPSLLLIVVFRLAMPGGGAGLVTFLCIWPAVMGGFILLCGLPLLPFRPSTPPLLMPMPPAAWYLDPKSLDRLRYWDGSTWTEHTHS